MVDVCDTFCGVETIAAALEMDQMDQMNQSALEPPKKWLKMFGVAGPSYIVLDPGEWFRFISCRYCQPRIGYQPSNMGIGNWKPPYIPIWCLHRQPVQARPPYLISPYLSPYYWEISWVILHFPKLSPTPPCHSCSTPCSDWQKMDQHDHWTSVISVIPAITINGLLSPLSKINQNLLLLNASRK